MTKRELINALEAYPSPDDIEVVGVACDGMYGDDCVLLDAGDGRLGISSSTE